MCILIGHNRVFTIEISLMPDIHLACNVSKEPVNCPFFNFRAEGATAVRLSYGFKCYECVYKTRKPIAHRHIVLSLPYPRTNIFRRPRDFLSTWCKSRVRAISAQPPYGFVPTVSQFIQQSHDNRTQCKHIRRCIKHTCPWQM